MTGESLLLLLPASFYDLWKFRGGKVNHTAEFPSGAAAAAVRRIAADASQLLHSFSAQIRHADDEHIYFGRIPPLSRQQQFFVSELFDVVFLRNLSSCYALHTTLLRRRAAP